MFHTYAMFRTHPHKSQPATNQEPLVEDIEMPHQLECLSVSDTLTFTCRKRHTFPDNSLDKVAPPSASHGLIRPHVRIKFPGAVKSVISFQGEYTRQ